MAMAMEITWRSELGELIHEHVEVGERFTIDDVYEWEGHFEELYPKNRHPKETLRGMLQRLRREEVIKFEDWEGTYLLLRDPRV